MQNADNHRAYWQRLTCAKSMGPQHLVPVLLPKHGWRDGSLHPPVTVVHLHGQQRAPQVLRQKLAVDGSQENDVRVVPDKGIIARGRVRYTYRPVLWLRVELVAYVHWLAPEGKQKLGGRAYYHLTLYIHTL